MGCCQSSPDYERLPLYNDLETMSSRKPTTEQLRERAMLDARFYLRVNDVISIPSSKDVVSMSHVSRLLSFSPFLSYFSIGQGF